MHKRQRDWVAGAGGAAAGAGAVPTCVIDVHFLQHYDKTWCVNDYLCSTYINGMISFIIQYKRIHKEIRETGQLEWTCYSRKYWIYYKIHILNGHKEVYQN